MLAFTISTIPTIPTASADDTTIIVGADDSAFNVGASASQSADPTPPATSTTPTGHWETRPQCTLGGSQTCADITTCPDGTPMQHLQYILTDGTITATTTQCPTDEPPGPTPADIYTAFKTIPLPTPDLHIQPPGGQTLVNLPTIYYTRPTTIDTTLTVLGTTIDFHITTATYTWHYGDHTTTTTTTPGAPYPHQTNTHTYPHHGTIHPSLDTTYQADYRIHTGNTTGQWQHLTPTVTITGPPHTLTIHTATPHLTGE
jgi:hypothetical protein